MNGLTNKEAAILSELVYMDGFYDRFNITSQRGQTLYDIFFDNGKVSQTIVSSNPDIAMHLTNNYDHYAGVLNKYQLVETTSTIVEPDGQTPIKYELGGENSYSGIVLTEVSNPTNTVFVSRGTATKMDGLQDVALGAGFTPAYMQDAHKFYHDVINQQRFLDNRGVDLGTAKNNISTAGHSLGGTAAEAIALAALANGANVNTAQTFEGYGVDQLLSSPVSFVDDIFGSLGKAA